MKKNKLFWILTVVHHFDFGRSSVCNAYYV